VRCQKLQEAVMAKPTSPSPPHGDKNGKRHVDIRGPEGKIHQPVKNDLGATAIGGTMRAQARKEKGRKP
jgi:hypothetical protein